MEMPKWAEKIGYITCPVCGKKAIVEIRNEEVWENRIKKDEILLTIVAYCENCGSEIAIKGNQELLIKIIVE